MTEHLWLFLGFWIQGLRMLQQARQFTTNRQIPQLDCCIIMGQCCSRPAYTAIEMTHVQSPLNNENVKNIKLVVFGQSAVGKTSFVRAASGLGCVHAPIPTQDFECTTLRWRVNHTEIRLMLWDTPGAGEYYNNLTTAHRDILTRAVDGVVLIFDAFDKRSVDYILEKFAELGHEYGIDFPFVLIGSKKKHAKTTKYEETISLLGERDQHYYILDFTAPDAYIEIQYAMGSMLAKILARKTPS
jgi:GTPase SAR1 family protein